MKKSKYQQYFHCFIVCILGPYAFWFSSCTYLRPGAYQRKYGINNLSLILLNLLLDNMPISPEGPLSLQVSITVNVLIQKTTNPI